MRPSGKLPPAVYWRRRLLLLAVVLVLGWFVVRLLGGDDDSSAEEPPPTAATPTAAASSTAPAPAPKPRKAKDVQVDVRLAPVEGACPPEAVSVSPSVRVGAFAGRAVAVTLRVVSVAPQPCTVRIDPSTFVLGVKGESGSVWSTQTCEGVKGRTVDVHPSWATVVELAWDGRADADSCDDEGAFVDPGQYTAQAALLGGDPVSARFTLTAAPTPTPPTPSTPASPKPDSAATPKPGSTPTTSRTP